MNKRGPTTSTLDLVAAVSNQLTPTERRVAEAVLAEPTLLAFGTVSDLAGRVGTSRPSIVRFATKLGFGGYTELQQHVRRDLSHRLSRPSERIRSDGETVVPARVAINDAISSVFDALDGDRLAELAQPVARAEKVWILSGETSQAGAHALHSGLSMVRPGVRALEEHSYATDLSDVGPRDAAVVFDFFRYRKQVATAAHVFVDAGVTVVAITDSPLSPLVELADTWVQIEVPAIGPFDSSVPVVAMCELLVARVARDLQDIATNRIDRIEALWEETGVFL
ncbi:MAG: MurR/RpiR family transcriptional regulator [Gammaproteobacteria bacterium]|nr:MurR/RpiR family transcriptional regulator [Gammaproteobacteria bacterium]MDH3750299.1 MurR/RpiR family transcriptional regulator [Gammaproteobacteria bacterium]MDH3803875.1 MurR/RpiR family transcriptional regulator [Gammaproteobacteria bacterium]